MGPPVFLGAANRGESAIPSHLNVRSSGDCSAERIHSIHRGIRILFPILWDGRLAITTVRHESAPSRPFVPHPRGIIISLARLPGRSRNRYCVRVCGISGPSGRYISTVCRRVSRLPAYARGRHRRTARDGLAIVANRDFRRSTVRLPGTAPSGPRSPSDSSSEDVNNRRDGARYSFSSSACNACRMWKFFSEGISASSASLS